MNIDNNNLKMLVDYPTQEEIEIQTTFIVDTALGQKESLLDRIKKIYVGPGFKMIFYRNYGPTIVTFLVYALYELLFSNYEFYNMSEKTVMTIMEFPICYLMFAFLSCWMDEQDGVIELKKTMHYTNSYIVSLRMFYSSIILTVVNMINSVIIKGYSGDYFLNVTVVGISCMFIFAVLSLELISRIDKSYGILLLMGAWMILGIIISKIDERFTKIIFEVIPGVVHVSVAVICFIGFVIYVRKVEKRNAYIVAH